MSERTTTERTMEEETMDRTEHGANPDESGKGISALIGLLGVWMILEAFLFDMVATQFWNDILVGALLLAVGGYNYYRQSNEEIGSVAAASVAALLGLWLVVAPFVLGAGFEAPEAINDLVFWNDIVVGLVALLLGAYSAYQSRDEHRDAARRAATR